MGRSQRRVLRKRIGIVSLCVVTVFSVVIALYEYFARVNCEALYDATEARLREYRLSEEILPEKEDVRELYVAEAEVAEYLVTGDKVDVRIRYSNAEDYLILKDKVIVRCGSGNGIVLEVSEPEILLLASAIADSQIFKGTKLYTVAYPERQMLEAGTVNYIANNDVLRMLGKETIEGESRIALEERLALIEQ